MYIINLNFSYIDIIILYGLIKVYFYKKLGFVFYVTFNKLNLNYQIRNYYFDISAIFNMYYFISYVYGLEIK